MSFIGYVVF